MVNEFTPKFLKLKPSSNSSISKDKAAEIVRISSSIPVHPSKEVLEKSKFFSKGKKPMAIVKTNQKQSYAQVTGSNVSNILKLKENYPNLLTKKIKNIQKIINDLGKLKPCIKMTTKSPLQKQIIVSMSQDNISKFIASFSSYIANINKALRNIKLDIMADHVQLEPIGVTIVTNKAALLSNLQIIENFVRNIKKYQLKGY